MTPPITNMARSFINPKDRAAEVARRRQEAEEELRRRREERVRQIQEKSENALKRKQIGLQEKSNKTKTEAEHLREVNKRRLEKEILERKRIQQLLEKKNSPPRTTQSITKPKTVVAFGSSVPRRLNISNSSSNRSASSSSGNNILNTSSLMTRSVHPVMSPGKDRPTVRSNAKPPSKPIFSKPPPSRTKVTPVASPRKSLESRMTQSVHPQLCPTPNRRVEKRTTFPVNKSNTSNLTKKPGVMPIVKSQTQQDTKITKSTDSGIANTDESIVEASKKTETQFGEIFEIKANEEAPKLILDDVKNQTLSEETSEIVSGHTEDIKVEEKPAETQFGEIFDIKDSEETSQIQFSHSECVNDQISIEEIKTEENIVNEEIPEIVPEYAHNRESSDDKDSTRTRTITPQPVFSDDEHDSGVVPETPSPPTDVAFDGGSKQHTNHMFLLNTNSLHNGTHDNDVFDQALSTIVPSDPEQNNSPKEQNNGPATLTPVTGGVVIGLTEKLQQERDNRRAKLSEILSRTRDQSNGGSPVKSAESTDAGSLAKSLLARRSEKLNEDSASAPDEKIVSLAEEFENLGLSTNNKQILLPGQIPDTHSSNLS